MGGRGAGRHGVADIAHGEQPAEISDSAQKFIDRYGERAGIVAVSDNAKELSEDEIIEKLGGYDRTAGSCVSQALAYVANKAGLDVEDYRGGESQDVFASHWIEALSTVAGEKSFDYVYRETAGDKMAYIRENVKAGQEYIVTTGGNNNLHSAVVRKNGSRYQYLELQSSLENGWKGLTQNTLTARFNAPKKSSYSQVVAVVPVSGALEDRESLRAVMSLLNTAG